MKILVFASLVAVHLSCVAQQSPNAPLPGSAKTQLTTTCDCTSYPFTPNPPCFGACIGKLSSKPNPDLSGVKGLDAGVAVNIKVLATNPKRQAIDFSSISGKPELEIATDKYLRDKNFRLQATPLK